MFDQYTDQIREEAKAAYPKEAVWLITEDGCEQVPNIAPDPCNSFLVAQDIIRKAYQKGLKAIVHSHPDYPACPSEADMITQLQYAMPFGIVSTDGGTATEITWFGDQCPTPDLQTRTFIHGVTDCYSLIRDYYRTELGIHLSEYPRDWMWWQQPDKDLYSIGAPEQGFRRVPVSDIQKHDMFFTSIHCAKPNHGGVFIGNGLILHHVTGRDPIDPTRLPKKEPVHRWMRHITSVWRHKDVESKG